MVRQLSTSDRVSQPRIAYRAFRRISRMGLILCALTLSIGSSSSFSQSTDFELKIEPLTNIDKQFMTEQRRRVEQLGQSARKKYLGNRGSRHRYAAAHH
jgi:hypothetical protein